MNTSIEESKKTREVESRAYLGVKDAQFCRVPQTNQHIGKVICGKEELKPGDFPVLDVTTANSDHTPASVDSSMAIVEVRDNMISDNPVYNKGTNMEPIQGVSTVPKDGTFALHNPTGIQLCAEDIIAIQSYKKYLVIYGLITYRDVFKVARKTKFCYFYSPRYLKSVQIKVL